MNFSSILVKIQAFFYSILIMFFGFFPGGSAWINEKTASYSFSVDATDTGEVMGNKVSNMNIYSVGSIPSATDYINCDPLQFTEYIQIMQCTGGNLERDPFINPNDRTVLDDYDFSKIFNDCDNILALGAKPYLKLGSVPLKFTTDPKMTALNFNNYGPDNYEDFYKFIEDYIQALVDRYGIDECRKWRFGVWTEYESHDWFDTPSGKPEDAEREYYKLYDYITAAVVSKLGNDVQIGTHSMGIVEGLWTETNIFNHVVNGTNAKTGAKGAPMTFFDISHYDKTAEELRENDLITSITRVKKAAEAVGLKNLKYGIDEARIQYGTPGTNSKGLNLRIVGHTYQSAYDARILSICVRYGIDYISSWGYLSGGAFAGYPSVSYHVANSYYNLLSKKQLAVSKTVKKGIVPGAEVDVLAGADELSGDVALVAYNFKPELAYNTKTNVSVDVKLPDGYGSKANVTRYLINDDANFFDEWQQDRKTFKIGDDCSAWSPDDPGLDLGATLTAQWARDLYFKDLRPKYIEKSKLIPTSEQLDVVDGKVSINIALDANASVFYSISK